MKSEVDQIATASLDSGHIIHASHNPYIQQRLARANPASTEAQRGASKPISTGDTAPVGGPESGESRRLNLMRPRKWHIEGGLPT